MVSLVERLRMHWDDGFAIHAPRQIELEAADTIEHLLSVVEVLRKEVTALTRGDDARKDPTREA